MNTQRFELTTNHPSSSYGQPVLVVDGQAYGPADVVPGQPIEQTAAWWVREGASHLSPEQFALAVKFCALIGMDISLQPEPARDKNLLSEIFGDDR